jgi:ribosomal protein S26
MCIFAVQTVRCGDIAGNISKPVRVIQRAPIDGLQLMESHSTRNSDTTEALGMPNATINTVYITSISFLATALIITATIFTTVIAIKTRSKAKIKAALNRAGGGIHNEPVYEDVSGPSPSVSTIDT